jgi:hypothetical protein
LIVYRRVCAWVRDQTQCDLNVSVSHGRGYNETVSIVRVNPGISEQKLDDIKMT